MITFLQQFSQKNLLILAIVVVVLVGNGVLTWRTLGGAQTKVTLSNELEDARLARERASRLVNLEALKAELAAAQAELKVSSFPERVPSVDLVDLLVRAARETGMELTSLQVLAAEQEKVGAGRYGVVRHRLQTAGTPSQASAFLDRLEKGAFPSMVADNLVMSPRGNRWEVKMDLALYSAQ